MGLMTIPGRRWVWYGGRPSLDFVNTRRNREAGLRDSAAEYLREPADLAAWLAAAGLAAAPAGAAPVVARSPMAGPPGAGPPGGGRSVGGPPVAGRPGAGRAVVGSPVAGSFVAGPAVTGGAVDDETLAGALRAVAGSTLAGPAVTGGAVDDETLAGALRAVAGSTLAGPAVAGGAVDDETFAGALALREAIDSAVNAIVASGTVPPERDIRCVNDWIAAGPQRPVLRLDAGVPVLCVPRSAATPRGALALIAADAAELLGTELRDRLRICPGPGCRGRFLDDSPAGRRRWCSMAVCGNRSKAAAHRQATHAAAGAS